MSLSCVWWWMDTVVSLNPGLRPEYRQGVFEVLLFAVRERGLYCVTPDRLATVLNMRGVPRELLEALGDPQSATWPQSGPGSIRVVDLAEETVARDHGATDVILDTLRLCAASAAQYSPAALRLSFLMAILLRLEFSFSLSTAIHEINLIAAGFLDFYPREQWPHELSQLASFLASLFPAEEVWLRLLLLERFPSSTSRAQELRREVAFLLIDSLAASLVSRSPPPQPPPSPGQTPVTDPEKRMLNAHLEELGDRVPPGLRKIGSVLGRLEISDDTDYTLLYILASALGYALDPVAVVMTDVSTLSFNPFLSNLVS